MYSPGTTTRPIYRDVRSCVTFLSVCGCFVEVEVEVVGELGDIDDDCCGLGGEGGGGSRYSKAWERIMLRSCG